MAKKILFFTLLTMYSNFVFSAENRGRIQIQGSNPYIEKSSSWDSNKPITASEGLKKLDSIWGTLTDSEKKDRLKAYECAKNYIQSAKKAGGISGFATKSCLDPNRKDKSARIDIEVIKGKAFN